MSTAIQSPITAKPDAPYAGDSCIVCGNDNGTDYPACGACALKAHFAHRLVCQHCVATAEIEEEQTVTLLSVEEDADGLSVAWMTHDFANWFCLDAFNDGRLHWTWAREAGSENISVPPRDPARELLAACEGALGYLRSYEHVDGVARKYANQLRAAISRYNGAADERRGGFAQLTV
jgi:hypothetical protein